MNSSLCVKCLVRIRQLKLCGNGVAFLLIKLAQLNTGSAVLIKDTFLGNVFWFRPCQRNFLPQNVP